MSDSRFSINQSVHSSEAVDNAQTDDFLELPVVPVVITGTRAVKAQVGV